MLFLLCQLILSRFFLLSPLSTSAKTTRDCREATTRTTIALSEWIEPMSTAFLGLGPLRPFGIAPIDADHAIPYEWAKYKVASAGQIPVGHVYRYCLNTYNYTGAFPKPHGPPAWGIENPYAYEDKHKDANGSLGWNAFHKHPQIVTFPRKYRIHHAFIPLNPRGLQAFISSPWPFRRSYVPELKEDEVYEIEGTAFANIRNEQH